MFVNKQEVLFGFGRGTAVVIKNLKDNNQKQIKKKQTMGVLERLQSEEDDTKKHEIKR